MSASTRWLMLSLILAGAGPSGAAAQALRAADFAQVIPGKTKNEVRAMLGEPTRTYPARAGQAESWEYKYGGGRSFWVEFEPDGTVALTNVTVDMNSSRFGGP